MSGVNPSELPVKRKVKKTKVNPNTMCIILGCGRESVSGRLPTLCPSCERVNDKRVTNMQSVAETDDESDRDR